MSNVLACDRCGTSEGTVKTVRIWEGTHPDPSGNGSEDDFYCADLCENCMFDFFRSIYGSRDYDFMSILAGHLKKYVSGEHLRRKHDR